MILERGSKVSRKGVVIKMMILVLNILTLRHL